MLPVPLVGLVEPPADHTDVHRGQLVLQLLAAEKQVGNQQGMALGPQIFSEVLQGVTCASRGQLAEALGVYTLHQGSSV